MSRGLPWTALGLGLMLGCGAPAVDDGAVIRLIADDPRNGLDRARLLERSTVAAWSFETPEDLVPWVPSGFDQRFEIAQGVLVLQSSKKRSRLTRDVAWNAAEIDAVEVDVRPLARGSVRLRWARAGESFSAQRSLAGKRRPGGYLLDLARHPQWRGRIERLEIELATPRGRRHRLRSVRGVAYGLTAEGLAEMVERPWKIELDHELRSSLVTLPEMPRELRATVPADATLHFGYGLVAGARAPVGFAVTLDRAGESVALFDAVLDPGDAGRWHDERVDLARYAGDQVALRFETRALDDGFDVVHDLPAWSSPEIVGKATRPNVVLISIDTLRADHLSLYGYPRETSPFLDAWSAERAVVFEQVVAASPWTLPSHLSIFSGLDALRHGANHADRIPDAPRLLAEILREAGYETLAVTGGGLLHPAYGFARGFDRYRYWPRAKSENELDSGLGHALDGLEDAGERAFFLFFHTYEVHDPFRPRQPYFERFGNGAELAGGAVKPVPEPLDAGDGHVLSKRLHWRPPAPGNATSEVSGDELETATALYDSGIAYTDARLERLLTRLDELGLDRRTIVLLTSDHGEALGEKGLGGHAYLYDFNLLVPLLVALPDGRGGGRRITDQVRSIDVLPTVLELLDLPVPEDVDGASLVPLIDGRRGHPRTAWSYAAFSNRGLSLRIGNRLKYHFNNTAWPAIHGSEELYDLATDPHETRDVAGRHPRAAELRELARAAAAGAAGALTLRFSNRSGAPYHGLVRGNSIAPDTVKSPSLSASTVKFRKAGEISFTVADGDSFALLVERLSHHRDLELEGGFDAGSSFAHALRLDAPRGDWRLAYEGSEWRAESAATTLPEPGTGITVTWRRDSPTELLQIHESDPELTEQLRALGYVE